MKMLKKCLSIVAAGLCLIFACAPSPQALVGPKLREEYEGILASDNTRRIKVRAVKKLLRKRSASLRCTDEKGNTPLHLAATNPSNINVATLLIRRGASWTALNNDGHSPLDLALINLSFAHVIEFITTIEETTRRPIINERDSNGNTILHLAVLYNQQSLVRWLVIAKRANMNIRNDRGNTPAGIAQYLNHEFILMFLRGRGARF